MSYEIFGVFKMFPQDGEMSVASGIATEAEAMELISSYEQYTAMRIESGNSAERNRAAYLAAKVK